MSDCDDNSLEFLLCDAYFDDFALKNLENVDPTTADTQFAYVAQLTDLVGKLEVKMASLVDLIRSFKRTCYLEAMLRQVSELLR